MLSDFQNTNLDTDIETLADKQPKDPDSELIGIEESVIISKYCSKPSENDLQNS